MPGVGHRCELGRHERADERADAIDGVQDRHLEGKEVVSFPPLQQAQRVARTLACMLGRWATKVLALRSGRVPRVSAHSTGRGLSLARAHLSVLQTETGAVEHLGDAEERERRAPALEAVGKGLQRAAEADDLPGETGAKGPGVSDGSSERKGSLRVARLTTPKPNLVVAQTLMSAAVMNLSGKPGGAGA